MSVETSKPADLRHYTPYEISQENAFTSAANMYVKLAAHISEVERVTKERDEVLDILWRDIDDLRDPKLTVVQVAAKAANAIHWRNVAKGGCGVQTISTPTISGICS